MPARHHWTAEEEAYLTQSWGRTDPRTIARRCGCSVQQVWSKKHRLRLGSFNAATGLLDAMTIYKTIRGTKPSQSAGAWLAKHGLRLTRRRNCRRVVYTTTHEALWAWMEQHRDLVRWNRFAQGILGPEPAWCAEERRARAKWTYPHTPWSEEEDDRLRRELEQDLTIDEIAERHGRTTQSIGKHVSKLGKARPLQHQRRAWTEKELATVRRLMGEGRTPYEIALAMPDRPKQSTINKVQRIRAEEETPRPPMRRMHNWSDREKFRAAGLWRAGYTAKEIAEIMHRNPESTRTALRRMLFEHPFCDY